MCALVNLVRSNSEFDVVLCIILWSVGPVLIHRATNKTCIILLYTSIHLLVCTSKEHNIIHEYKIKVIIIKNTYKIFSYILG